MQISVSSTLTLYHDGQFWVGIVEHSEDGKLGVARIVFGAEPSDAEILRFVVDRWENLVFFGNEEPDLPKAVKNPKRRMRNVAKALRRPALSTKAQEALSQQRQTRKDEALHRRAEKNRETKATRYAKRLAKKKVKKKGH